MIIQRGRIYHPIHSSIKYFFWSLFKKENSRDVELFEKNFASYNNLKFCTAFPFARSAFYALLKSQNISKGDEVILPPITIKGMLDVVNIIGATPIIVDISKNDLSFNRSELKKKISSKTKAILFTPLFGICPEINDFDFILNDRKDILKIIDFSQALNCEYKKNKLSSFFDVAIYSASSIKTLDTLGGGFLLTNNKKLFDSIIKIKDYIFIYKSRSFLVKKSLINLSRNIITSNIFFKVITFNIIKLFYYINPKLVLKQTGDRPSKVLKKIPKLWLTKYSSIQGQIGMEQLLKVNYYDFKRIQIAEEIINKTNFLFPDRNKLKKNIYWQLVTYVEDISIAQEFFLKRGVDIATSSLLLISHIIGTKTPVAEKIYLNGMLIPCFPSLNKMQISYITRIMNEFSQKS